MNKLILIVLLLAGTLSCDKNEITPNQDISVKENKTFEYYFDSKKVKVTINEIQDSRCPTDVTCIRAGEAIVKFDITIDGADFLNQSLCIQCESPMEIPEELTLDGYNIKLTAVDPYPLSSNTNSTKTAVFRMN